MFRWLESQRARSLCAVAFVVLLAAPAPAFAYKLTIYNPLPNRVWVTVRTASIIWSGWIAPKSNLRYESRMAKLKFEAEIAKLGDNRVHPEIICRTGINAPYDWTGLTIHLSGNRCWW